MASATHSDTYRPSEDEPFMNDRQKEYFRRKLLNWKDEIFAGGSRDADRPANRSENHATSPTGPHPKTDRAIELRARDRQRKVDLQDRRRCR